MGEFQRGDVPPHVIAMADQELASVNHLVDQLIAQWDRRQPEFDTLGFDELAKTCSFMLADVLGSAVPKGLLAALTVCIIRLARHKETQ